MLHYRKGENVEKELNKNDLPFNDCMPAGQQENFLWMHVKGGTKVGNVLTYATNALDKNECRTVVWSGCGGGVVKTISCAEILKRNYPLYQVTRMCYNTIEEHWLPQMDGLEEIVVNRQIPTLHILMSLDVIDDSVNGLQKPGTKTQFWVVNQRSEHKPSPHNAQRNDNRRQHKQQPQKNKRGSGVDSGREGAAGSGNGGGGGSARQKQSKMPRERGGPAEQATSAQQQQQQPHQQQQQQQSQTPRQGEFKGKSKQNKNRQSNSQQQQRPQQQQSTANNQSSVNNEPMKS